MEVKMSSKNQIVIPKAVRQQLGLVPGDRLHIKPGSKGIATITKAPSLREELDRIRRMSPPSNIDAVKVVRALRDEWDS